MFDYLLVYPVALLIGGLTGLFARAPTFLKLRYAMMGSSAVAGAFAIAMSLEYLSMVSLWRLLKEMALPGALVCAVIAAIATVTGWIIRRACRRIAKGR